MLLYEQIQKNKRKTVLIVFVFILFLLAVGAAFSYINSGEPFSGMIITVIIAAIYVTIVLSSSTSMVMRMNHAKEIKSVEENRFLWHTVENMAMVARIPMPRVFIVNDPSPNAFATGISPKNGAVAVTTGLMNELNREEMEGVIAHEVAHIKNYDVRLSTIALALVSVIAIISDLGMRMMFFSRGGRNNKQSPVILIIALVLVILAPIIAMMINMAISRNREYLADASAADLTRNPNALATALEKITGVSTPVREASGSSAPLYFADPLKKKMSGLMSTHPDPQERIRRLREM
ncbi:zinc metalloprotease HtpX [Salisediminibacterium selenitireducens]|uniref:Protease HtpX homolog n=1 Tax=Bacillus selenitireducens (strain ATCC 700615 / DSM 15326 / MLS10) TaxID=439292 RepID=D6XX92_BACIE|nr:zinc metalloprotease HtpX [Salisediminibacterium selenitireducens]ADH97949.1 peptidase M48 Ste24p [[Bacillus] selenitireducens MLS10]